MKVIDLLNKIANGDRPSFIYKHNNYIYDKYDKCYKPSFFGSWKLYAILNDEVEIIEEEPRDIEVCGSLFTKSEYDKLAHCEEEHKIPEKLNYQYRNLYGRLSQHKQSEIDIIDTLNGVIDYLKSKGE